MALGLTYVRYTSYDTKELTATSSADPEDVTAMKTTITMRITPPCAPSQLICACCKLHYVPLSTQGQGLVVLSKGF